MAVAMKQKDLRSDSWNHPGVSGREDVNQNHLNYNKSYLSNRYIVPRRIDSSTAIDLILASADLI